MFDFLSWTNLFYLLGLILAGVATLMASKYKAMLKEVGDVAKTLEEALLTVNLTQRKRKKS